LVYLIRTGQKLRANNEIAAEDTESADAESNIVQLKDYDTVYAIVDAVAVAFENAAGVPVAVV